MILELGLAIAQHFNGIVTSLHVALAPLCVELGRGVLDLLVHVQGDANQSRH